MNPNPAIATAAPFAPPAPDDAPDDGLRVVHEDAACIIVCKPVGMLSVPGRRPDLPDAASFVRIRCAGALVVHRLDQATSGLLLFARGADMQRALSIAFMRRAVRKRYVAVVAGELADDSGIVELPLAADWPRRPMQKVDFVAGKPSTTRWRVLERSAGRTRVELEPLTGRSHQLRVHLAAIGHPIVGDSLYAPDGVRDSAQRLLLHACELAFEHPLSGAPMRLRSAAPF